MFENNRIYAEAKCIENKLYMLFTPLKWTFSSWRCSRSVPREVP